MKEEITRFIRVAIIICAVAIILVVVLKTNSLLQVSYLIGLPTLVFMPIAIFMIKYKATLVNLKNSKHAGIGGVAGILIGIAVSKYLTFDQKIFIVILGFEILCLYYVLYNKVNNNNS